MSESGFEEDDGGEPDVPGANRDETSQDSPDDGLSDGPLEASSAADDEIDRGDEADDRGATPDADLEEDEDEGGESDTAMVSPVGGAPLIGGAKTWYPYITKAQFDKFLARLENRIPDQIDRDYIRAIIRTPSMIYRFLRGIEAMKFIDREQRPTPRLRRLVVAATRRQAIAEVLGDLYGDLLQQWQDSAATMSDDDIVEFFRGKTGMGRDSANKMKMFFKYLLGEADFDPAAVEPESPTPPVTEAPTAPRLAVTPPPAEGQPGWSTVATGPAAGTPVSYGRAAEPAEEDRPAGREPREGTRDGDRGEGRDAGRGESRGDGNRAEGRDNGRGEGRDSGRSDGGGRGEARDGGRGEGRDGGRGEGGRGEGRDGGRGDGGRGEGRDGGRGDGGRGEGREGGRGDGGRGEGREGGRGDGGRGEGRDGGRGEGREGGRGEGREGGRGDGGRDGGRGEGRDGGRGEGGRAEGREGGRGEGRDGGRSEGGRSPDGRQPGGQPQRNGGQQPQPAAQQQRPLQAPAQAASPAPPEPLAPLGDKGQRTLNEAQKAFLQTLQSVVRVNIDGDWDDDMIRSVFDRLERLFDRIRRG